MTALFTRFAATAFALVALSTASCKKDESQITINPSAAPTLTADTATPDLVLTTTNATTSGTTFTYTAANYGYQAAVSYTLQVDKKGGNFSAPQTFSLGTTGGTFTLTKSQLVNAFFALGYPNAVQNSVDVRVVASVGATAPTQTSSVVTLTGTPTPVCIPNATGRTWSLIGPAGTDWNTDIPLTYDCYTQTFKATLPLKADEFKFRANNDWTVNFGIMAATSTITTSALAQGLSLVNNNNNLKILTAGTYTIVLAPSADGKSGTVSIKP